MSSFHHSTEEVPLIGIGGTSMDGERIEDEATSERQRAGEACSTPGDGPRRRPLRSRAGRGAALSQQDERVLWQNYVETGSIAARRQLLTHYVDCVKDVARSTAVGGCQEWDQNENGGVDRPNPP